MRRGSVLQTVLLAFALGCAALGLSAIIARLSSGFMFLLSLLAVLTGWMLTRARLPHWLFALLGSLLGLFGLILTVGRIGQPLGNLLSSVFDAFVHQPNDFSIIAISWDALREAFANLVARFTNWFRGIGANSLIVDPLIIAMLWGFALWLAALWALWWTRKRSAPLTALLPAVSLLAFNVYYSNGDIGLGWLIFSLGGMLALQASVKYGAARNDWETRHVEQEEEIDLRLAFFAFLLTASMMLAGGLLPSIPYQKIANAVKEAFRQPADQNLAKSLGLEQTPGAGSPVRVTPTPMVVTGARAAEVHAIGPGPAPDATVVMYVSVDGYNPPPVNEYAAAISQSAPRYYWRARTYDLYNGSGWSASDSEALHPKPLPASAPVQTVSERAADRTVTQRVVRARSDDASVYAAGEIVQLDQPSTILRRGNETIAVFTDADRYAALSRIPSPSVDELRAAGAAYPDSLRRYLELPDGLPQRVLDLALDLTVDEPTPFDRAAALEAYLRQFPYSRQVPAPPVGRDAVDFFLFDLKTGYCDYYATAMVTLARAAGLPARFALGYSEGAYDPTVQAFVVRASNAHAWVEIYFPTIGWVGFEPTASMPRPYRPGQAPEDNATNLPPPGEEARLSIHLERTWLGRLILWLSAIALVIFIFLLLPLERWQLSLLPTDQALTTIFRRLYRRGRSLGIPPNPSRTPNEFAFALASALDHLAANEKRAPIIASLRVDLESLTNLYSRLLFTQHPPREEEKHLAIEIWARIRRGFRQVRLITGKPRKGMR